MTAIREVWFSAEAFLQRRGGVSRCFCEVANSLEDCPELGWRPTIRAGIHRNAHLDELARETRRNRRIVSGRAWPISGSLRRWSSQWSDRSLRRDARRHDPSGGLVIHDTGYRLAAAADSPSPIVITVHDLINDEDPSYRRDRPELLRQKSLAIARAARIVVPSFATRDALVRVHRVDEARIDVIHHGSRMPLPEDHDPIGVPYLLHVGSRGRYKDFATLMRA
ncbi:MAG: hypothetical protein RJA16_669, partial [Planctomycetota bacterium]